MCVPTASVVATPVSVATPVLSVTAEPTAVPSSMKSTVSPAIGWLVSDEVSVAIKVAVPPKVAVPETLLSEVAAWLTSRSPEFWLNRFVLSPAKLATIPPVSVPAVSLGRHASQGRDAAAVGDGRAGEGTVKGEADDLADKTGAGR